MLDKYCGEIENHVNCKLIGNCDYIVNNIIIQKCVILNHKIDIADDYDTHEETDIKNHIYISFTNY